MLEGIELLCHSALKINKNNVIIYVDPFHIKERYNDADFILITHSHYDHFSEEDIQKVRNKNTTILITEDLISKVNSNDYKNIVKVEPFQIYEFKDIKIETIPAYNINKQFHPRENNWVGYILTINQNKYYVAGDTDITKENKSVKCDVAFVPVGGTYTMDAKEAVTLVNEIKPKIAVPIHYGEIVGSEDDAIEFVNNLNESIEGKILK